MYFINVDEYSCQMCRKSIRICGKIQDVMLLSNSENRETCLEILRIWINNEEIVALKIFSDFDRHLEN